MSLTPLKRIGPADTSFAALDVIYGRDGGSGILDAGGAADPRIVVWARIRGLRLEEFQARARAAAAGCAAMQLVRYARSGQAVPTLAAFLGPGDRRVMRIVAPAWRDLLQGQRWQDEERAAEDGLEATLGEIATLQAALARPPYYRVDRHMQAEDMPMQLTRLETLRARAEAELERYAQGRRPMIQGLARHFPKPIRELLTPMAQRLQQRGLFTMWESSPARSSLAAVRAELDLAHQRVNEIARQIREARWTGERLVDRERRIYPLRRELAEAQDAMRRVGYRYEELVEARTGVSAEGLR
jgi:DNA repair exonuclease SbcCD ATPase subunit